MAKQVKNSKNLVQELSRERIQFATRSKLISREIHLAMGEAKKLNRCRRSACEHFGFWLENVGRSDDHLTTILKCFENVMRLIDTPKSDNTFPPNVVEIPKKWKVE